MLQRDCGPKDPPLGEKRIRKPRRVALFLERQEPPTDEKRVSVLPARYRREAEDSPRKRRRRQQAIMLESDDAQTASVRRAVLSNPKNRVRLPPIAPDFPSNSSTRYRLQKMLREATRIFGCAVRMRVWVQNRGVEYNVSEHSVTASTASSQEFDSAAFEVGSEEASTCEASE